MEESLEKSLAKISVDDPERDKAVRSYEIVRHITLLTIKGERTDRKEQYLQEWQERDRHRDELLESAKPRNNIKCLACGEMMNFDFKTNWSMLDEQERVLLFYSCPNGCVPNRALFSDGEEYSSKPTLCEKCSGRTTHTSERKGDIVTTIWTCDICGYEDVDKYDFSHKEKKDVPIDETLRKKYCLDEKELEAYRQMKRDMDGFTKLMEGFKARQEDTKTNVRMESLQKLRVAGLQERITKVLEKIGMTKVELSVPTNDRGLKVRITMFDSHQDRSDSESKKMVKMAILKSLHNTNWRLISTSLESTLGAISGELRGYTSDEEIRKIVEKENASNTKRT